MTPHNELTPDDVKSVYFDLLEREPSSQELESSAANFSNKYQLAVAISHWPEFRFAALRRNNALPRPDKLILIGTHHKTGTHWMANIFYSIAYVLHMRFVSRHESQLPRDFSLNAGDILHHSHSVFDFASLPAFRGLHMIRDPRDVIISGAFFHDSTSEEAWLHVPEKRYGGVSYQEKMRSLGSVSDKLRFEMDNIGGDTIAEMSDWRYDRTDIFEAKYEHFIGASDLRVFSELFHFLGFGGPALPLCLEMAWRRSIFSGGVRPDGGHIRSGERGQWRRHFTPEIAEAFLVRFPDILTKLGYEADNSWADRLRAPLSRAEAGARTGSS
jgi:hypothetical protein